MLLLYFLGEYFSEFFDGPALAALEVEFEFFVVLEVADGDEVVVVHAKGQPGLHVGVVLLVLVVAVAVLGVEVGEQSLQEEQHTPRVRQLLLRLPAVGALLLTTPPSTSPSVGFTTKMCRLQESLLTASQLPYRLNAME